MLLNLDFWLLTQQCWVLPFKLCHKFHYLYPPFPPHSLSYWGRHASTNKRSALWRDTTNKGIFLNICMLYTYEQPLATRHNQTKILKVSWAEPAWLAVTFPGVRVRKGNESGMLGMLIFGWSPNLLYLVPIDHGIYSTFPFFNPIGMTWNFQKNIICSTFLHSTFKLGIKACNCNRQKKIVKVIFLVHFWESLQNLLIEILKLKKEGHPWNIENSTNKAIHPLCMIGTNKGTWHSLTFYKVNKLTSWNDNNVYN